MKSSCSLLSLKILLKSPNPLTSSDLLPKGTTDPKLYYWNLSEIINNRTVKILKRQKTHNKIRVVHAQQKPHIRAIKVNVLHKIPVQKTFMPHKQQHGIYTNRYQQAEK